MDQAPPSPQQVALHGLCPRCGAKTLFTGWVKFAARCSVCGLDFSGFDVGDGPAAFLTLIVGTIVVTLAVLVEIAFAPPWWLHVILWVPLTVIAVMAALRVAKAALIAAEYRTRVGRDR